MINQLFPPQSDVLSRAQAESAGSVLKTQEDNLTKQLPVGVPTPATPPSSLFQKFIDTGDQVFKVAASHSLNALTQAVKTIPSMLDQGIGQINKLIPPNLLATTVKADFTKSKLNPTTPAEPKVKEPKLTFKEMQPQEQQSILDKTANAIATNETSIVKGDKYSSSQYSGVKAYGRALGKYRVTEGELKAYAPKFLGEVITPAQFLAHPVLQDNYIKAKAKYYLNQDYSPEQVADIHNKGVQHEGDPGSTTYQNPHYVNSFDLTFNSND